MQGKHSALSKGYKYRRERCIQVVGVKGKEGGKVRYIMYPSHTLISISGI